MRLSQRDKQAVDNFLAGGCAVTYGSEVVGVLIYLLLTLDCRMTVNNY